jgi:transposase InsO family protein
MKQCLVELVDAAVAWGGSRRDACKTLELKERRYRAWSKRLANGKSLEDKRPGGGAAHGLLQWEEDAIVDVTNNWAHIDRSHRKLAARAARLKKVFVCPSTFRRVLKRRRIVLPKPPQRARPPYRSLPDWVRWKPNHIWIWDVTHFPRAGMCVFAIMDVVSRKWIATLVSAEETSTQVQVVFAKAFEAEGLLDLVTPERVDLPVDDPGRPILIAMSDNGPQMKSATTREFMELMAIAQHHGRPHTPTDQAWIETLFGHIKAEWPHLETITDPAILVVELDRIRIEYNTIRLHAGIGYVTPEDEHTGRGEYYRRAYKQGKIDARQRRLAHHQESKPPRPRR